MTRGLERSYKLGEQVEHRPEGIRIVRVKWDSHELHSDLARSLEIMKLPRGWMEEQDV